MMLSDMKTFEKRMRVLDKRNEIIAKVVKNMSEEEAKEVITLLNEFQQLHKNINLE
jgi:hypothetical protein